MNSNERQVSGQASPWMTRLDIDRRHRTGIPEVLFAEGKPVEHTLHLLDELRGRDASGPALATRCPDSFAQSAVRVTVT